MDPNYNLKLLLENSICNVYFKEKNKCEGFFCKINFMPIYGSLPVLILNSYLIKKDDIFIDERIDIIVKNNNKASLIIDESRKIYTEKEKYGLTIIEIKEDDGLDIHSFLEIDPNIMENKSEIIYNKNLINLFYYSFEKMPINIIPGIINSINFVNQIIDFYSLDNKISVGSPIINKNNNKIIGIIKTCDTITFKSIGIFFKGLIKEFIDETLENKSTITIIYKNIERRNIILFGKEFIALNKNYCTMVINGKEKEICESDDYLEEIKKKKESKFLKIKLKILEKLESLDSMFFGCNTLHALPDLSKIGTTNVKSFKNMFNGCSSLVKLSDLSKWDTKNIEDLSFMFYGCSSLIELPDISNWDTSKVKDISNLFSKCSSLKRIPDISKWNTSNIINMTCLFNECPLISKLPDISNWDTNSTENISYMFCECTSLTSIPDISKWYTGNVNYMNQLFSLCTNITSIPDISNWNTNNVNNINNMFEYCSSLESLPDISKWNTENVHNMEQLFKNCHSLKKLPDISKWKTQNVSSFSGMFLNCSSLKTLPDISKWNTKSIKLLDHLFNGCSSLIVLPDISEWDTSKVPN